MRTYTTLLLQHSSDYVRRATIVEASLGHAVQYFDVAHLTADRATGERVVRFNTIAGKRGELDMISKHVEPLCYPLLFCHGEDGWGQQDSDDIPQAHMCVTQKSNM